MNLKRIWWGGLWRYCRMFPFFLESKGAAVQKGWNFVFPPQESNKNSESFSFFSSSFRNTTRFGRNKGESKEDVVVLCVLRTCVSSVFVAERLQGAPEGGGREGGTRRSKKRQQLPPLFPELPTKCHVRSSSRNSLPLSSTEKGKKISLNSSTFKDELLRIEREGEQQLEDVHLLLLSLVFCTKNTRALYTFSLLIGDCAHTQLGLWGGWLRILPPETGV